MPAHWLAGTGFPWPSEGSLTAGILRLTIRVRHPRGFQRDTVPNRAPRASRVRVFRWYLRWSQPPHRPRDGIARFGASMQSRGGALVRDQTAGHHGALRAERNEVAD